MNGVPAKIRKGGGLPRSSAEGGWYRGAAPITISNFSLAANSTKQITTMFVISLAVQQFLANRHTAHRVGVVVPSLPLRCNCKARV